MKQFFMGLAALLFAIGPVPAAAEELVKMEKMLAPVWTGETSFCESVFVAEEADGSVAPIPLLYDIEEVISVRSLSLETAFEAGRDYLVEDGKLVIPEGSRVPRVTYDQFHPLTGTPGFEARGGGYVMFIEGVWYHRNQIAVTYRHAPSACYVPPAKGEGLPRTLARLEAGRPLKIVFSGDSITAGYNASGTLSAPPNLPAYPELTAAGLRARCGSEIEVVNTAVPGMGVEWGRVNSGANVSGYAPDLVVLAFGMNDIRMPAAEFAEKVIAIIDDVRAVCPETEFVLVATMLPNREAIGFWGNQREFGAALEGAAAERTGVVVADMGRMHGELLKRKRYADMTGNMVNHPNDYLMRVYAQTLLRTLERPEAEKRPEAPKQGCSGCGEGEAAVAGALALGAAALKKFR